MKIIMQSATFFNIVVMTCFFLSMSIGVGVAEKINSTKSAYHTGKIDRITPNEVVIDDCLFKFSPNVHYLSKNGNKVTSARFIKGDKVAYLINNNDRVVILKKYR